MEMLKTITFESLPANIDNQLQIELINELENGKVIYFPHLAFTLSDAEQRFLSPQYVDRKNKNISYDLRRNKLKGAIGEEHEIPTLQSMMARYANWAQTIILTLFPHYQPALETARTSFRPVEISGRSTSIQKDDTRLHVDAFPATPNQGCRILRVFSNVHPESKPRVWRLGEPFVKVAERFMPTLRKPVPGSAKLLQWLKLTKSERTLYDHYMLHMHDTMKADDNYQRTAQQMEMRFPPGSTWIVYTDCVSHAAMSGQHLFEQTFHLPVSAMHDETASPLRILERITGKRLV